MQDQNEDYWFNVGGVTVMLMMFIIMLPLMFMAEWTRLFTIKYEKILFGVVPMLIYLFIIYFNIHRLIKVCRKYAIAEMKSHAD